MKIYVTGLGVISAIGLNVEENFHSLRSEKSGIKKTFFGSDLFLGMVDVSNEEIISKYNLKNGPYSRTSLLAYVAAKEAWGTNLQDKEIRTGIISATTVGGMDNTEEYYRKLKTNSEADISLLLTHDSGNTTEKIAADLGISGYINTLSTACSSSANAIMLGARLMQQNRLDRVVVGGADALTHFTIKGFHSLFIFDAEWCKPFDENRNGLNLGEGAAFLVLENEKSISKTKNKPLCLFSGWSNAADAYHQTASSPEGKGATLAMKEALQKGETDSSAISYINAHGTGTKNNDLSESAALKTIFEKNIPPFSSTKAFTGHTLAASG
ncbi:MAG: beta-ketoacyl-[acyl-carrier-protein] synthase family protein, partial [Bacteroidia bacterium]|nr:beta-ketoacyl-[acyl-carrier-protein] synthase family protein [Bacteroidia bacterium]